MKQISFTIFLKHIRTFAIVFGLFNFSLIKAEIKDYHRQVDSLYRLLNKEKTDTNKINLLNAIAVKLSQDNLDSALIVCNRIIAFCEQIKDKERTARAYYFAGTLYFLKGDYPAGIEEQFKALHIAEENKMYRFNAQILNSIGNVFMMQVNYDKALIYYHKAFALLKQHNLKDDMARVYSNIGLIYAYQKDIKKALYFLEHSLEYRKEAPNLVEEAITYDFIGFAYLQENNYQKAITYLDASLNINRKLNNTVRIIDNLRNRGECELKLKDYPAAEKDISEALEISKKYGHVNGQEGSYILLSELYKKNKNFERALDYYEQYVLLRDSMFNQENTRKTLQQEVKFEYDKKALADSIRRVEEKKVVAAQLKQEKTQRYALIGGLCLVAMFALFMVNRFRVINKQKQIIAAQKQVVEEQKLIVEEKQKEVMDSIHYAKRIQTSHLPSEKYLTAVFKRIKNK